MLAIQATGRVVRDAHGLELYVTRLVPVSATETWAWFMTPAKVKKWLPSLVVDDFSEPTRLTGVVDDARITFSFVEVDGGTRVFLSQRLSTTREAGTAGPKWEYLLDSLLARVSGTPTPVEQDYATQQPYYERLAMDGDPSFWPTR